MIGDGLVLELLAHRYDAHLVRTGDEALAFARASPPDAVLLDLGLPGVDGVFVCRALRRALPAAPIVIVTARDTEVDIVVGLDAGATDYVTKPFSTHVLLARLRAHLRSVEVSSSGELIFDELRIDVDGFRVFLGSTEVAAAQGGRPPGAAGGLGGAGPEPRPAPRRGVGRDLGRPAPRRWRSTCALRRKLGPRADGRPWISTVRSFGYRFEP
ncbi:MAG: response regulator transcription factor [Ilumatobacteraceae bacterium]